ncbi:hypothetical protein TNCV_4998981 [Trichonephila clavipes]|nr:hypothetical protein TNCV_4998981 [Trichonephila clavipes]
MDLSVKSETSFSHLQPIVFLLLRAEQSRSDVAKHEYCAHKRASSSLAACCSAVPSACVYVILCFSPLLMPVLPQSEVQLHSLHYFCLANGVVGLEGDNDEEEKSTPLTGKLIQEDLQLCSKLENHFHINDPNSERASKLQRELQNCMSGYRELYKKIKESSSQSLITDYIVRKGRATQNENEVCENPWSLPQISMAETVSSDDEGDLEPLRKRCKPLSDSDND